MISQDFYESCDIFLVLSSGTSIKALQAGYNQSKEETLQLYE